MTMEKIIEGVALVKRFGAVEAIDNISIDVSHGESLCVIGPNGASCPSPSVLDRAMGKPTACR